MTRTCFSCGSTITVKDLYGYPVCESCEPGLGLFKDHTILRHIKAYEKKQQDVPENPSYQQDVDFRVNEMEERYIRARLKLLHIQSRIRELTKH